VEIADRCLPKYRCPIYALRVGLIEVWVKDLGDGGLNEKRRT